MLAVQGKREGKLCNFKFKGLEKLLNKEKKGIFNFLNLLVSL